MSKRPGDWSSDDQDPGGRKRTDRRGGFVQGQARPSFNPPRTTTIASIPSPLDTPTTTGDAALAPATDIPSILLAFQSHVVNKTLASLELKQAKSACAKGRAELDKAPSRYSVHYRHQIEAALEQASAEEEKSEERYTARDQAVVSSVTTLATALETQDQETQKSQRELRDLKNEVRDLKGEMRTLKGEIQERDATISLLQSRSNNYADVSRVQDLENALKRFLDEFEATRNILEVKQTSLSELLTENVADLDYVKAKIQTSRVQPPQETSQREGSNPAARGTDIAALAGDLNQIKAEIQTLRVDAISKNSQRGESDEVDRAVEIATLASDEVQKLSNDIAAINQRVGTTNLNIDTGDSQLHSLVDYVQWLNDVFASREEDLTQELTSHKESIDGKLKEIQLTTIQAPLTDFEHRLLKSDGQISQLEALKAGSRLTTLEQTLKAFSGKLTDLAARPTAPTNGELSPAVGRTGSEPKDFQRLQERVESVSSITAFLADRYNNLTTQHLADCMLNQLESRMPVTGLAQDVRSVRSKFEELDSRTNAFTQGLQDTGGQVASLIASVKVLDDETKQLRLSKSDVLDSVNRVGKIEDAISAYHSRVDRFEYEEMSRIKKDVIVATNSLSTLQRDLKELERTVRTNSDLHQDLSRSCHDTQEKVAAKVSQPGTTLDPRSTDQNDLSRAHAGSEIRTQTNRPDRRNLDGSAKSLPSLEQERSPSPIADNPVQEAASTFALGHFNPIEANRTHPREFGEGTALSTGEHRLPAGSLPRDRAGMRPTGSMPRPGTEHDARVGQSDGAISANGVNSISRKRQKKKRKGSDDDDGEYKEISKPPAIKKRIASTTSTLERSKRTTAAPKQAPETIDLDG